MTDVTTDAFFGGRVTVFQPRKGFRAGTDSILLATALPADATGQVLEFGCGAGGALLPAMSRLEAPHFTGLEKNSEMVALARRGLTENAFDVRGSVVKGDVADMDPAWQNRFDLVFSNPPFFEAGAIPAPGAGKDAAFLESVTLKDWINAMLFALKPKGTIILVHRAADLARILSILQRQSGEITVLPIHSYPGEDAKRVLVRARKGLRPGPLRLLEPRYLYTEKGGPRTAWAFSMQQDGIGIDWN